MQRVLIAAVAAANVYSICFLQGAPAKRHSTCAGLFAMHSTFSLHFCNDRCLKDGENLSLTPNCGPVHRYLIMQLQSESPIASSVLCRFSSPDFSLTTLRMFKEIRTCTSYCVDYNRVGHFCLRS